MFQDEIKYLHVKIEDSYQENIYRVIDKALKFMEDAFDKYYAALAVYNDQKAATALSSASHMYDTCGFSQTAANSSRDSSACNSATTTTTATFYLDQSVGGSSSNGNRMQSGSVRGGKQLVKPRRPIFLIHCNLGISRSSSILIAYLINKYKLCLYAAFNYVKDKRLQIAPNYSFLRQLKQFEEGFY